MIVLLIVAAGLVAGWIVKLLLMDTDPVCDRARDVHFFYHGEARCRCGALPLVCDQVMR